MPYCDIANSLEIVTKTNMRNYMVGGYETRTATALKILHQALSLPQSCTLEIISPVLYISCSSMVKFPAALEISLCSI